MINTPTSTLAQRTSAHAIEQRQQPGTLRPIGRTGQGKLKQARVALIGCGALGSTVADLLVRAGIGELTIIDREYVELHNLQRQSMFTEDDVSAHTPKSKPQPPSCDSSIRT